ncbi:hypothetical protein JB92DRAFT_1561692 [Gautieria morchelliformis]|nr:hypothetical protein JB92DRAFT_1561692 [Gautieria morchelliformis]
MQSFTIILALAARGATALSVRSPVPLNAPLRARQLNPSQVPQQCQTQCAPIVADLQSCTTNLCTCTTQVANDYQACLNCLASLESSAAITADVANAVSSFNTGCASVSTHIPLITAPPAGTNAAAPATGLSGTAAPTLLSSPALTLSSAVPTLLSSAAPTLLSSAAPTLLSSAVGAGAGPPAVTQTALTVPATGSAGPATGSAGAPSKGYGDATRLSWRALGALALVAGAYLS